MHLVFLKNNKVMEILSVIQNSIAKVLCNHIRASFSMMKGIHKYTYYKSLSDSNWSKNDYNWSCFE